ncbi:MAG TPA: tripartite tricarboxylate transporter TctB family protein [Bacteroidales bacterium]|nr:tripartite tricarboxylate transporter TctB family protein [Bacteroidales bacterium]
MLKLNTKKIIPLLFIALGLLFALVGYFQLGFWTDGPGPGFFPSIMAMVMITAGVATFILSMKEEGQAVYIKDEFLVILAGVGIFVGTFIIGLVPTIIVYLLIWLRVFEKISWKLTAIIMSIALFITIGVFGMWLGIQFPMGLFELILG